VVLNMMLTFLCSNNMRSYKKQRGKGRKHLHTHTFCEKDIENKIMKLFTLLIILVIYT